jgi:preprotein translocase subunit SecG
MSSTQPPQQTNNKEVSSSGLFSNLDPADSAILKKAALAVVGLWIITPILLCLFLSQWTERGTFGDLFGSVNALFSGLALLGIIATILLQQKELSLSTRELRNSAKALQKQVELAADTARLQVLPGLIQTQKVRIESIDKIYGGRDYNDLANQDYKPEVVFKVIQKTRQAIEDAPPALERLRELARHAPTTGIYLSPGSKEEYGQQITSLEKRQRRDVAVLPEQERLYQYLLDLENLYTKIANTTIG